MPRHLFQVTVNLPASFRNNLNNNEVFNPYLFVRNRLYHFVFNRFALLYARLFPEVHRKLIEFFILLTALFCFLLLVYVHVVFVQTPITCLEDYRDVWQNNGILRVEVLSRKGKENYTLEDSYWKEKTLRLQQFDGQSHFFYTDLSMKEEKESDEKLKEDECDSEHSSENESNQVCKNETIKSEDALQAFTPFNIRDPKNFRKRAITCDLHKIMISEESFQTISEESILASDLLTLYNGAYIMEFSLEYGYLRLRPSKRKELNISVTFVVLDPEQNKCFGGPFNTFLLDNFLGYDNVLLASIKNMAEKKDQKGFVRNAVMEIEYIFINNWTNDKSYFTAGFVMMVFTLTISTLLRHSHHQIFIVVGYWMHHVISSLERRSNIFDVVWPRNLIPTSGAPVLTVILALVGMEAVMSDFFHDRSIALHVIVIVWSADLYDAVCCQSALSKRHWFRFFYLYHFLFYAYNYKFSGVYWPLTLLTSWLFIFHSMVFFFHHYELPRFLHRAARLNITINQNQSNNNRPPQNNPPDDDPSNNQEAATPEPSQPSSEPENSTDNPQRESDSQDQPSPNDNLVTEGIVSAAGYDLLEPIYIEKESPEPEFCEEHHLFQIRPHFEPEDNPRIKENVNHFADCPQLNSSTDIGFHKSNNKLKSSESINKDQTCELKNANNNDFSKRKSIENSSINNLYKEIRAKISRFRKKHPGKYHNAKKETHFWSLKMRNDLHSRELNAY